MSSAIDCWYRLVKSFDCRRNIILFVTVGRLMTYPTTGSGQHACVLSNFTFTGRKCNEVTRTSEPKIPLNCPRLVLSNHLPTVARGIICG